MNSLKTLVIVAVLAAVAYGVHLSINRKTERTQPLEEAPAWSGSPKAQIPGPQAARPQFPGGTSGTGAAPPYSSGASAAPGGAFPGGSPGPYPSRAYPGQASNATSPGARSVAGNPPPSSKPGDNLTLRSDLLRDFPGSAGRPTAGTSAQDGVRNEFATFMQAIERELDAARLAEAHLALSRRYDDPNLPPAYSRQVIDLLDQIAGTVIYSRQHLLEPPYTVQPRETLQQIAEKHGVPWQLLGKINGVRDLQKLQPGSQLKVVRGPFNVRIHLARYELTLMLKGRYAGRFPIGVGLEHAKLEGRYVVCGKTENPQYYGPDGTIDADDPSNPYGEFWLGLAERIGQQSRLGIHGTNDPNNLHRTGGRGWICLGDKDIEDVFSILSVGSRVEILR